MDIEPQIALVTGGARRIGEAIVRDLATHGFCVAIHHNGSAEDAEALSQDIISSGGQAFPIEADLTDMAAVSEMVPWVAKRPGTLSLLVNNASIFEDDSLGDFDEDIWNAHFDIHVKAPAVLTKCFANALPQRSPGLVVNIVDQRVWRLTPRFFSYTLSKSALWTATQTMAQALAPRIRVNAIGPGPTLPNERQSADDFDLQSSSLPLLRGPSLDEFGATIRWLWQTPSVTGQMIALDGGQHLAWETPDVIGAKE